MHSDSVYRLVDELVKAIGSECGTKVDEKVAKTCRSLTFGVLLHGKRQPASPCTGVHRNAVQQLSECAAAADPLEALECHHFELLMTAHYRYQMDRCGRFERLLDEIRRHRVQGCHPLPESDRSLLQFLLSLKNSSTDDCRDICSQTPFFSFSKMPALRYGPYPIFRPEDFRLDERLIASCYDEKSNPYLLRATTYNVFTANLASMIADQHAHRTALGSLPVDCSYFSDTMAPLAHFEGPFRYNLLKQSHRTPESEPPEQVPKLFRTDTVVKPQEEVRDEMIFGMNWENLGQRFVPKAKSFTSECRGSLFPMLAVEALTKIPLKPLDIKIVTQANLLRDIKFLLTGVSSSIFHFDETNCFRALPNLTLEDVQIGSMTSLLDRALEIGTCFRRLQMMCRKNPYTLELLLEGFVFKAFCESVDRFLACYRLLVNAYEGPSLLQLLHTLVPATEQLLALAALCGIHPRRESDCEFPTGSRLLDHLHRELLQATQPSVGTFLLGLVRRCSLEYFALFQRWLFGGQLHDPSGELFVYFVDHYRPNTKHFFDKAYLIRRQSVPVFLRGFEEDVLLCGKYAMLLKAFRPLHPVFSLRQPDLSVCLSFEAFDTMRSRWLQYAARARRLCGPAVSVRELYEAKERARDECCRRVEEGFRTFMEGWRREQTAEAQELKRKKQQQLDDLLDQLSEIRASKLSAKRQELLQVVQDEHGRVEADNRRLLEENYDLTRRVRKYTELNRLADAELERLKVTELSIVPVVTVSSEEAITEEGGTSEGAFQSCRESYASATSPSIYEDAQKSPLSSVDSSSDGGRNLSTSSVDGADATLDATLVESPIVPVDVLATESDRLNSNLPIAPAIPVELSEGERNRQKVLGSSVLAKYLNEDHANANVQLTTTKASTTTTGMRKLTEAQRNKLKILSQEFEITTTDVNCNRLDGERSELRRNRERILISDYTSRPDEPTNRVGPGAELTELQRNRAKIMSQEYNLLLDGGAAPPKATMYLTLDTDRARNRRRVMDSEYGLITGAVEPVVFPDTPMSVDSDTVESSVSPHPPPFPGATEQDINANPLERDALKLDVGAASEGGFEIGRRFGIPDTATLEQETPADALKGTSDQLDGFDFAKTLTLERDHRQRTVSPSGPLEEDELYREFVETLRKRCTNFCRLAIPDDGTGSDEWDVPSARLGKELHSLDPLTVTRFLQYSLVIPLRAHMEIVNNEILKLFLYDLDLLSHFESLRNYFLLMDGEFSSHICDSLFGRLETVRSPNELLNYQTLHAILDGALYSSNAGMDRNAERLSFIVCQVPERFDLYAPNAVSMLNLSYRVEWPLNLILTPETLEQYTNVFRYLVKVRRISYALENAFELLKDARKRIGSALLLRSPQYARVQLMRHKLSQMVMALATYLRSMLHASWDTFRADLQDATATMEDLYRKHRAYVKRIIFVCLLNKRSAELYDHIEQVFRVVLLFYRHLRSKDWRLQQATAGQPDQYVHPRYEQMLGDEREFDRLVKGMLQIGEKMYDEGYLKEISEFLHLVNINGYYDGVVC
ncbi:gamma-tubulin complex component 6 [Anopheles bellator]|uniref:gamma-tubulin complex component 6 n=1 Tax=Anopheles bellator TaxID=139047 RepID=UPI00264A03CA|nr:gamma-tubulin complex component 6 [Anopheles bellator]